MTTSLLSCDGPDPNPSAWPSTGPAENRWFRDLPGFLARLRRFHWGTNTRFKYVTLVVDTRFGHFRLRDRDGVEAGVDEIFPPGSPPCPEADIAAENEQLRTALLLASEEMDHAVHALQATGDGAHAEQARRLRRLSGTAKALLDTARIKP